MTVYILTYSKTPDRMYGNLLALRTARRGFPTASIIVTDNNSCSEATKLFRELSAVHGYEYRQLTSEISHPVYLQNAIGQTTGSIVICDPDVIFWEPCENLLDPKKPIKGRLQPSGVFQTKKGKLFTAPRLHTSLLFIADAVKLDQELQPLNTKYGNPWEPQYQAGNCKKFYDTGSIVYERLKRLHSPFTNEELDCFDHLLYGTHADVATLSTVNVVSAAHHFAQVGVNRHAILTHFRG